MITKKTITFTALMASIVMLTISGTTQAVYSQILSGDLHEPGQSLLVILAEDGSGSISDADFATILAGEVAALEAFYAAGPDQQDRFDAAITYALIEFSTTAVQVPVATTFTVTDDTTLTALTDAITGKTKSDGFTCITCVIELADTIAGNAGKDVSILDISTDGVPEGPGPVDTEALALAARDAAVVPGGNLDGINALGISLDQDGKDFLLDLVWPQPGVDGLSTTNGFVVTIGGVDDFAPAFQDKLFTEVAPECGDGIVQFPEQCDPQPPGSLPTEECDLQCRLITVGGESLPIDSTALLMAGMSANLSLIVPIAAGIAGVGVYFIRSRMNKD